MADNLGYNEGTSASVATDDIGSRHYQWMKLAWGIESDLNTVSASAPMPVQGGVGHDTPVAGSPVRLAGRAIATENAAVSASNDVVDLVADMVGKLIVLPYANPENFISATASAIGTASVALFAASTGIRVYATQILVTNSSSTIGTEVSIVDGTTIKYGGFAAASGGFALTFPTPLRFTANTVVGASCVSTAAEGVRVSIAGYKGI